MGKIRHTFEQWCLDNNRLDILNRWDYELNKCKPSKIGYSTKKKYYFKCPKNLHKSELKSITAFVFDGYEGNISCKSCNSFAQWGINNLGEDFLEKYWDYEKNININPWFIAKASNKKVWIRCQETDYHGSHQIQCNSFVLGQRCGFCCGRKVHALDSFAQYHINNTDSNFIKKFWSNKNIINPYEIAPFSNKKIYIKCQTKDYHGDYLIYAYHFTEGERCPFCSSIKVHPLDSFGEQHKEELNEIWDYDKNLINPFSLSTNSAKKIWIRCKEHNSYLISPDKYNNNRRCPICSSSKGEKRITQFFQLNNIFYIPQKEFDGLVGNFSVNLSYDFYLPDYNLLIEYQGEQHEKPVDFNGFGTNFAYKKFKIQQEYDRRKREYAQNHNINLLEIWYWDYDNIEEILVKELNLKE